MPVLSRFCTWALAWCLLVVPALSAAQPSTSAAKRLSDVEALAASLSQAVADLRAQNKAMAAEMSGMSASHAAQLAAQNATIATLQASLQREVTDRITYADGVAANALASANSYSDTRLAPVSDKLVHFSRSGNNVYITGANLHLRNGLGATLNNGVNGLGNLIVGYNESRNQGAANPDVRTGSHNIVTGTGSNYARTSAFLTGVNNASGNHFASVLGGTGNAANGTYSVVVGGYNNQANGGWSVILGGRDGVAGTQLQHIP
jgi:hypothetical protein